MLDRTGDQPARATHATVYWRYHGAPRNAKMSPRGLRMQVSPVQADFGLCATVDYNGQMLITGSMKISPEER
jgi:hypothetical protein